jgi:hypothetical protein
MIKMLHEGFPLDYLKSRRRELVEVWKTSEHPPTNVQLRELADVQLCISAVEAVISEIESDRLRNS